MGSPGESLEVLVLCSSPVGDLATLKLPHELAEIENRLRKAQVSVRMKRVYPPTIDQLRRELAAMSQRGVQPGVFHFLGHGDDDGLYFEDEFGQSQLVKGSELKSALSESPVKLVLKLTDGLPVGPRAFVSDDGLPTIGNLPDTSVFFGRQEQLVEIARALSDSSLVGVGVWGIGGIGKTALVLNAARRNAWRYRGTAWIDIREATQKTTVELLRIALGRLSPGANRVRPPPVPRLRPNSLCSRPKRSRPGTRIAFASSSMPASPWCSA